MGIDSLGMVFRLEKSFGLKIERGFWDRVPQGDAEPVPWWTCGRFVGKSPNPPHRYERIVPVVTAGDVHSAVCAILAEKGMTVPSDSWERVQVVLSDVTGCAVEKVKPQSLLFQDLGFS